MATHPTRSQQKSADLLADALLAISEAARLDGGSRLDRAAWGEITTRLARVSSAFDRDAIVARALQKRCSAIGLASSSVELLTLIETEMPTVEMLLLDDETIRSLIAKADEELGGL
jgi:hypothetical protein